MATEQQNNHSWSDFHEPNEALEQNAVVPPVNSPDRNFQVVHFHDQSRCRYTLVRVLGPKPGPIQGRRPPVHRRLERLPQVDSTQIVAEIQGVEVRAGGGSRQWRLHPDHNTATIYDRE